MVMKTKVMTLVGVVAVAAVAMVGADGETRTFRSPTALVGIMQNQDLAGKPQYEFDGLMGRDLVNLALGAPRGTARSNEVVALEVECDGSGVKLVVYDKVGDTNLTTIATSTGMDVVQQQDKDTTAFPNRERFVAVMAVDAGGGATNGLLGGHLTVAGRLHLDPNSGCPRAVLVDTDRHEDKLCGDPKDPKNLEDRERDVRRAGRAHLIGVLNIVSLGETNTVIIPHGVVSIRRQVAP